MTASIPPSSRPVPATSTLSARLVPARITATLGALMLGALVAAPAWADGTLATGTLAAVQKRGFVQCGVNVGLAGFSSPDSAGRWTGLDVDICRAVAAAALGDATLVKFSPLSTQQRFTALQSGEVDLLARNTTWTLTRDTANGMHFAPVTFYDGQGFLVPKKLGVKSAHDLDGATVCVQTGTTTEQNLTDWFQSHGMKFQLVVVEALSEVTHDFFSGRCDVLSSDTSQLASVRAADAPTPDDYQILPEVISKEPLAPAVRHGDDQWFDLVRWTVFALIDAEEKGVSSASVDAALASPDPSVQRLLGVQPGLGQALGVSDRWAYTVIKQVGNYGEIFERNVGKASPLRLERGLNALWTQGGLMYAPPLR